MRTTIVLVLVLAACSKSDKPAPQSTAAVGAGSSGLSPRSSPPAHPASVTDDMIATVDHVIAAITKLATDLGAAPDCDAATAAVHSNQADMKAAAPDADKAEKQWASADTEAQRWFKATYGPRFTAANQQITAKATACMGDVAFKAAFDEVNSH